MGTAMPVDQGIRVWQDFFSANSCLNQCRDYWATKTIAMYSIGYENATNPPCSALQEHIAFSSTQSGLDALVIILGPYQTVPSGPRPT